ncbi:hypothetical protein LG329_00275 [Virgibacillus necropolis]|uniref:hypothetical protein n=1 Tax=Virgibacillus necropolis TaxID=163877 RepID=UPI00384E89DE
MNKQEAINVLETIRDIYPKFEVTKRKASLLIPQLKQMDYPLVMKKLSAFVATHPYAPTLAEIAVYPEEDNVHLANIHKWRAEADKVPIELKHAFHERMVKLLKEKTNGRSS